MTTRNTDPKLMQVSDAVRKLNPGVFSVREVEEMVAAGGGKSLPESLAPFQEEVDRQFANLAGKKRLRQDTKGPNKLEREFEAWLRDKWKDLPGAEVHAQAVTLVLANGVRYTPDFMVLQPVQGVRGAVNYTAFIVLFYETKGFMRADAGVKLKMAARIYPGFKFYLVTKRKKKAGGGWDIQEILP